MGPPDHIRGLLECMLQGRVSVAMMLRDVREPYVCMHVSSRTSSCLACNSHLMSGTAENNTFAADWLEA